MKQLLKGRGRRLWACVLGVALSAAVLASPAALAATLPSLPADECVVDDAGVLSDETTAYMDELNGALEANCAGAQIGVLTVQYTGSESTEEYALEAFNAWGIGSDSENNGVLILLVMESPLYADGDYYLTYGDGFNNTTLSRQASVLAQTMEDSFAAKDYDAAVQTCAAAVADTIADIYGVSLDTAGGTAEPAPEQGNWLVDILNGLGTIVVVGCMAIVMFIIVIAPLGRGLGLMWGPFLWGYHPGPRPPHGGPGAPPPPPPHGGRGPRPPRGGGFGGGFGGGGPRGGFGGMGGGASHGGGGGRGR